MPRACAYLLRRTCSMAIASAVSWIEAVILCVRQRARAHGSACTHAARVRMRTCVCVHVVYAHAYACDMWMSVCLNWSVEAVTANAPPSTITRAIPLLSDVSIAPSHLRCAVCVCGV